MNNKKFDKPETNFISLTIYLVRSDLEWLGRILLKIINISWQDHPIQTEEHIKKGKPLPTGPFATTRQAQVGDLLLWVPYHIDSFLIDNMTGKYGYSHTTVDTGEIDIPTGKPVMMESTIKQVVTRKFQDQFEQRAFARVPISKVGVNVEQFVDCVKSKMGEGYDYLDALTLGEVKDPVKEVCSGLAADCLPEAILQRIGQAKKAGLVHGESVSVHSRLDAAPIKVFVSPNGFAEYFGVPRGRKITHPNTLINPQPVDDLPSSAMMVKKAHHMGWVLTAGLLAIFALIFTYRRSHAHG